MTEVVLSAGLVPVRQGADGQPRYLVLRAYRYWDFPKGEVGGGEDPLAAALREVAEETTLSDLDFPWGEDSFETAPYRGGRKVARYYLGRVRGGEASLPVNPEIGRPEHHELRWLPYEEARRLLGDRVRAVLDRAHERVRAAPGLLSP